MTYIISLEAGTVLAHSGYFINTHPTLDSQGREMGPLKVFVLLRMALPMTA